MLRQPCPHLWTSYELTSSGEFGVGGFQSYEFLLTRSGKQFGELHSPKLSPEQGRSIILWKLWTQRANQNGHDFPGHVFLPGTTVRLGIQCPLCLHPHAEDEVSAQGVMELMATDICLVPDRSLMPFIWKPCEPSGS